MDKDISSFLGKQYPASSEKTLAKIQATVTASVNPLLDLVGDLVDQGFTGKPEELIPAKEVLKVAKESIALIGNAFNYISQARRRMIVDSFRPKLAAFLEDICKDDLGEDTTELFGPCSCKEETRRKSLNF